MIDWMKDHGGLLWGLGAASIAVFIVSLVVIPVLVARIESDYFTHESRPPSPWADQHPMIRMAILLGKNLLGGILMLGGLAMFVLPGQGLLTMLVGFLLLDFPGKYKAEKWLLARRYVRRPINWLRRRRGRPPLRVN